ncbi:hypothetical protein RB601_004581 [Gaeumannomyces tritici]
MSRKVSVTAFDGSFAPLGRPTERSPLPWYSNRQYFLASWLDVSIWKAAVRSSGSQSPCTPTAPSPDKHDQIGVGFVLVQRDCRRCALNLISEGSTNQLLLVLILLGIQILELVGTTCQVFISGQFAATIIGYGTPQIGGYIGIFNIFLVSTFIYATAAGSGGHLNQAITLSAILSGICPLARGTLYMVA